MQCIPLSPAGPLRRSSIGLIQRCQAGSALHTMAVLQVFQAKLLRSMDESGQEHQEAFKELHTAADLALHATKATVQAIGKNMASLVVHDVIGCVPHILLHSTEET